MASARTLFISCSARWSRKLAIAADKAAQAQTPQDSRRGAANTFIPAEEGSGLSSGLIFAEAKPRDSNQLPAWAVPLAKSDDGVCYTMRMYKLKRKEHLAARENGSRGYSTCELASNYQFRSAIVHTQTAERPDSQIIEPQK